MVQTRIFFFERIHTVLQGLKLDFEGFDDLSLDLSGLLMLAVLDGQRAADDDTERQYGV